MTVPTSRERADILEVLAKHRGFLRQTVEGMSEEQIRARSTVSQLCLGAIVKHVLVHEIGHHFGLSDDDMEAIEASVA